MENKIKTFLPIGEIYSDERLAELIEALKLYAGNEKKEEIQSLLTFVNDKVKENKKKYEDVVTYISQFFGKYVHMKFYYNANYSSTRETDPVWYCDYEANVYLYRYYPSNYCLFGIYNDLNNEYIGGVYDKSIDLYDKLEGHKLEINQITAEEFLNTAKETISKCLFHRFNKVKSVINY
jgi:hypothetical protein